MLSHWTTGPFHPINDRLHILKVVKCWWATSHAQSSAWPGFVIGKILFLLSLMWGGESLGNAQWRSFHSQISLPILKYGRAHHNNISTLSNDRDGIIMWYFSSTALRQVKLIQLPRFLSANSPRFCFHAFFTLIKWTGCSLVLNNE
jgi:hypothetical protein